MIMFFDNRHDIFDEKALLKSSMYLQVLQLCPHIVENLCWSVLPGEQDVGEAEQGLCFRGLLLCELKAFCKNDFTMLVSKMEPESENGF